MLISSAHIGRLLTIVVTFALLLLLANLVWVSNSNESSRIPYGSEVPGRFGRNVHPIEKLVNRADAQFIAYEASRSVTFPEVLAKYRKRYGRHPPPNFDKWYQFAKEKGVWNYDDFDQIWDDLRPFWSIPPKELRLLVRGMLKEELGKSHLTGLHIRNGKVTRSDDDWRGTEMGRMIEAVVKYLPDMDIAMNRLDQPRVVAPWEDVQKALKVEEKSRKLPSKSQVQQQFTQIDYDAEERENPGDKNAAEWFDRPGKPYMDLAAKACSPESPARNPEQYPPERVNDRYKLSPGGFVSNFNLSSDLCTVGPTLANLHGMLFSASTIVASQKIIPIFGECKVNVNNDILFPANMYYKNDERYVYDAARDVPWEQKDDKMFWRGITSGGVQVKDSWRNLHRHRLVLLSNSTELAVTGKKVMVIDPKTLKPTEWDPVEFAQQHMDVGFPGLIWCVPDTNCGWLYEYLSIVSQTKLTDNFVYKYLIDVDGHSFSGRWHAFLKSKSLGFKATIFREFHDSRLVPWRHFIPMDNRYDDYYSLMTYFMGDEKLEMPRHEELAKKIADQGREYAEKVLRREDLEVYMLRLLLEYGRLLDDNRETIGYAGDGREVH